MARSAGVRKGLPAPPPIDFADPPPQKAQKGVRLVAGAGFSGEVLQLITCRLEARRRLLAGDLSRLGTHLRVVGGAARGLQQDVTKQ